MARKSYRVTLLMHSWVGYLHGVLLGIADYFEQRPDWIWTHIMPMSAEQYRLTEGSDGIIAYVEEHYVDELRKLRVPLVNVSNWFEEKYFPRVTVDDRAVGQMAGEYLMDLGLRHFGTLGMGQVREPLFSRLRREGFDQALAQRGMVADDLYDKRHDSFKAPRVPLGVSRRMLAWLRQLPRPAGVFATQDNAAAQIISTCRFGGIRVPEDVCVLGVDNDELISKISRPPLSSIDLPTRKIGYEAARTLDRLMSGKSVRTNRALFPPLNVIARQSTNLLAIPDEDTLMAVRYIREHVHERLTVGSLLRAVPINRRHLERKFARHVGRTPLQEIHRVRLEKAKELLAGTDLSMPGIAKRSGFPNPERLANVFRAEAGVTPTEYRRQFRLVDV